jgi:PRTRC genetic system ThiF family protein
MAKKREHESPKRHRFTLNRSFLSSRPLSVAVVGVGGTGSEVVSKLINLHLALVAIGHGGLHVSTFDPDVISEANVVRQRYYPSDIGLSKAIVLINRINMTYALGWDAYPSRFTGSYANRGWDLVISCVDTRQSRNEIHKYAFKNREIGPWKFWLDCGNDRSTGQVILGTPRSEKNAVRHILPCATELHPELMDTSIIEENTPSYSAIESLQHQDLMVNSMVTVLAIDLLWKLFLDKEIHYHARYFDLTSSSLSARNIPPLPPRRSYT